ncbi:hypothetical protein ACWKWN_07180 [Microbacterium trichothecenolyticum]
MKLRAFHDRPPTWTLTRQSALVSTQMLADVSSTYRSIGPNSSGDPMNPFYRELRRRCQTWAVVAE